MHDCSYVNIPFLKYIIYEATGGKQNILLLHNNTSYQTFFFLKLNSKVLFSSVLLTLFTGIVHLTKILFPPLTSSDPEFVISMYILKYSNNLDSHLFQVRADTQDREVDLETEVYFGFEKMFKATIVFYMTALNGLGLFVFDADYYHNKS